MQYKMEGYSSRKVSYTDARRVNEKETKRKPKVCSRFVLTIFSSRIVTAQAGIPKLSANTCFKLVLPAARVRAAPGGVSAATPVAETTASA